MERVSRSITLVGSGSGRSPGPGSPEAAAEEYFYGRVFMGRYAPRPPIERWRKDQAERFERELLRLEAKRERDRGGAVGEAGSS